MGISKNLADSIRRDKLERDLSVAELAEELHLAVSTTQEYLNGNCNPRADTLELLAERMGMPVATLISSPPSGMEQAANMVQTAKALAVLPPDKREKGARLLLELAGLFAGED